MGVGKRRGNEWLGAAPSDQYGADDRFIGGGDHGAAGSAVAGLAIEGEFPSPLAADRKLIAQAALLHGKPATLAPIDMTARDELDRFIAMDAACEAERHDAFERPGQMCDGPIMHGGDGIGIGGAGDDGMQIDRDAHRLTVELSDESAALGAWFSLLVEKDMGGGRHHIIGQSQLAGAMGLSTFDQSGRRELMAEALGIETMIGGKIINAAAAIAAEDHDRRDGQGLEIRKILLGEGSRRQRG